MKVLKHDHGPEPKKCEHQVRYCEKCDVVECTVCGQEWVAAGKAHGFRDQLANRLEPHLTHPSPFTPKSYL